MKFTAREEISAPAAHVFERMSDADRLEGLVRARGGKISRSPEGPAGPGTQWKAEVAFRGSKKALDFKMSKHRPPETMVFEGGTSGLDMVVRVDVVAISPHSSRLVVETEAKPRTLGARLLIQSAKLAKGKMEQRYKKRVADYANVVEREYRTA